MKKLSILYLEDNKMDVEIVELYLDKEKIEYELTNVYNRSDFISALKKKQFDIILLDYYLPSFDGLSALAILKKSYPDIPAMIISGKLGEEQAIETLKAGATDYVLKQQMSRFIPSLIRAIKEAEEQRKRKQAEQHIKHLNSVLKAIRNVNQLIVTEKDRGCPAHKSMRRPGRGTGLQCRMGTRRFVVRGARLEFRKSGGCRRNWT